MRLQLSKLQRKRIFDMLFARQHGACALCSITQTELEQRFMERWYKHLYGPISEGDIKRYRVHTKLHIDHCHKTELIRGLLCEACNTALMRYENYYLRPRDEVYEMMRTAVLGKPFDEWFEDLCQRVGKFKNEHQPQFDNYMKQDNWMNK